MTATSNGAIDQLCLSLSPPPSGPKNKIEGELIHLYLHTRTDTRVSSSQPASTISPLFPFQQPAGLGPSPTIPLSGSSALLLHLDQF